MLTKNQRNGRRGAAWAELEGEGDGDDKRMVVKRVEPGSYSVDIRPNSWVVRGVCAVRFR